MEKKSCIGQQRHKDPLMNIPSIEFLGVVILWPVTVLSNLFLAVLCAFLCRQMYRAESPAAAIARNSYWARFFLFLAIATLAGAIKHGFHHYPGVLYGSAVLVSCLASGVATTCAQLATVETFVLRKNTRFSLRLAIYLQLAVFMVIGTAADGFLVATANSAMGLIPVLLANIVNWRFAYAGSGWIAAGLLLSFFTGLIYVFQVSIGPWFTHLDISHILMMVSLVLVGRGINQHPPTHCFLQRKKLAEIN
ncbi:MAG: hypothetical protein IH835_03300 [Proteobacteria bacterium]|nr:hypothetical protein [Pseudomonadota bacterium]